MNERGEITETLDPQFGASPVSPDTARDGRLQVDIGNYKLVWEGVVYGELWVEYDPAYPGATDRTIEHWMLFRNYVTPSAINRDVHIRLVYEEGRYRDVEEFIAKNRENPGTKYIKAICAAS